MGERPSTVRCLWALLLAALGWLSFVAFFAYSIAFVHDLSFVPQTVNRGHALDWPAALALDVALIGLFAVQHSVMARAGFKAWWVRWVAPEIERSMYVLASVIAFAVIFASWAPIDITLWSLDGPWATLVRVVSGAGFAFTALATLAIDHLELTGLRQVWCFVRQEPMPAPSFVTPWPYRLVRHPMQLGVLIAIWATPRLTLGHVVFAAGMTAYVIVGLRYEERDLARTFGQSYRAYRTQVPMLLPWPRPRAASDATPEAR